MALQRVITYFTKSFPKLILLYSKIVSKSHLIYLNASYRFFVPKNRNFPLPNWNLSKFVLIFFVGQECTLWIDAPLYSFAHWRWNNAQLSIMHQKDYRTRPAAYLVVVAKGPVRHFSWRLKNAVSLDCHPTNFHSITKNIALGNFLLILVNIGDRIVSIEYNCFFSS